MNIRLIVRGIYFLNFEIEIMFALVPFLPW